jgi:hypothetical protein
VPTLDYVEIDKKKFEQQGSVEFYSALGIVRMGEILQFTMEECT